MSYMKAWWELAFSRPVAARALKYAVVVGAVLIAINHGDALLRGDINAGRLLRMGLTVLVPYVVSTLSSVGAMRQMVQTNAPKPLNTVSAGARNGDAPAHRPTSPAP